MRSERRVRRADPSDAGQVARLLHDFNTEFDETVPDVDVLTARYRAHLASGEVTVLLGGEGPDGFELDL